MTVLVVGLALSACGSSSTSSATGGSAAGGSAAGGSAVSASSSLKGQPFNLGALCSCSGVQSASYAELSKVSQVWASYVNAHGGINGHPVKITMLDDGGAAATALQNAKKLVEGEHVQAVVGDSSTASDSFASYLAAAHVPAIAGENGQPTFIAHPDFYASGPTLPVQFFGMAALAKSAGRKTLGVMYCAETPGCKQVPTLIGFAAKLFGLKTAAVSISSTAPSYAAPCLTMKSHGVDALFVGDNGATAQKVIDGCAQLGYRPTTVSMLGTFIPNWLPDSNFSGSLLVSSNAVRTDTSNPAIAEFLGAVKQYAPSVLSSPEFSQTTLEPWIAGQMFKAAAEAGHLTPSSTPAEVTKALGLLKNNTLGGLAAPLTIKPGEPVFVPCYYGATIKSGALQPTGGGTPSCLTATQASALVAGLKKLG